MQVTVILFFFSLVCLASTSASTSSSHCGELDINCPLVLKGSSASCNGGYMEVICEGNETIWYFEGNKYLIAEISYPQKKIRLVDPALLSASYPILNQIYPVGNIGFNNNTLAVTWSELYNVFRYPYEYYSFVNCSRKLNDSQYIQVPCLSTGGSNVYVVKVDDLFFLSDFPISCENFAGTITNGNLINGSDIFTILKKGFFVGWSFHNVKPSSVKACQRLLRDRYRWNRSISTTHRIRTVLKDEYTMLSCLFHVQNHVIFGLEVLLTFCADIAVLLLVGRIIFAPLVVYIFLIYKYWNSFLNSMDAVEKFLRKHATFSVRRYDFSDIVAITNHFREMLGHGGFGTVYKAKLLSGTLVAVKMLNDSKFGGDDFINEVGTIGKIHHANIVQLVGFCSEGSKRALIYEYMPNGSLDNYIFSRNNNTTLSIKKRKEIAIGIARGIDYLHRGCEMQILHFDIKPHNILLDNNLTPKISDFGMAKLYPREYNSVVVSAYGGTLGYIAPELISRSFGTISHKADVYSFGMLLLELVGGRKNIVDPEAETKNQVYYPSWIYDKLTQKEKERVTNVSVEIGETEGILAKVGLWCIQSKPSNRPSMNRVIEMLQMEEDDLDLPPKPFANMRSVSDETPITSSLISGVRSVELSAISEEISLI